MTRTDDDMGLLGDRLCEALGTFPGPARRAEQQRALLTYVRQADSGKQRLRLWAVFATVAIAGGIGLGLVLGLDRDGHSPLPSKRPRLYVVTAGASVHRDGQWLESHERSLAILFSGGSRAQLHARGTAQVLTSAADRVSLRLVHGTLDVEVRGSTGCVWSVTAGAYQVTVVGTRFTVAWDIGRARLRVTVSRGRVRVLGPALPNQPLPVRAGEVLRVDHRRNLSSLERSADTSSASLSPSPPGKKAVPQTGGIARRPAPIPTHTRRPMAQMATRPALPSWTELYKRGRYLAAVKAADRLGFDRLLRTISAADLWRLSKASRYARQANHATGALLAFRRRFQSSARARTAAFLLGRIFLELAKQPATASRWFRTYLQESPKGSLAEEALGRYINACKRAGHTQEAARAAKQYLKRYPKGIFRNQAKSVRQHKSIR